MPSQNLQKARVKKKYTSKLDPAISVLISHAIAHPQLDRKLETYLLNPNTSAYKFWWYFTTVCSIATGFFTPWEVAFSEDPGLSPYNDANAGIEYFLSLVFLIDILVLFNLPRVRDDGLLETSRSRVAYHYLRTWFAIDVLGVIPFGAIVGSSLGMPDAHHLRALGLLRLLRLVRLRRVFTLFQEIETNIMFPLMVTTLIRNISIVVIVGHFAGCMFYFTSVFYGRDSDTWIGASRDIDELTDTEKYIHSFYYSITTMTTVGYGDYSPKNTAEIIFATVYMIFNIVLNSYILGTITMVVIKADEKSGSLREMYGKLNYFSSLNHLDRQHTSAIKNYIQFHLDHPDLEDEDLLKNVPLGTRRMVLKSMYLPTLERLHIFQGVSTGFLMRMLESANVDIYTPDQQIIAVGDHVHELHTLLTGSALCTREGTLTNPQEIKRIGEGQSFLIDKFFTMEEIEESITSESICRVLLIPRSSYLDACQEFPHDAMQMAMNTKTLKGDYASASSTMEQGPVSTPIVAANGTEWDSDTGKYSPHRHECPLRDSSSSMMPPSSQDSQY